VDQCGKCSKYMWKQLPPVADPQSKTPAVRDPQSPTRDPARDISSLCPICQRNERIQSMLNGFRQEECDGDTEICEVEVSTLLCATRDEDKLEFTGQELKRHREKLDKLERAKRQLDSNPLQTGASTTYEQDITEHEDKLRHAKRCVQLLELHERGVKCFRVVHRNEPLGLFKGKLADLVVRVVSGQVTSAKAQHDVQSRPGKRHAATGSLKHMRMLPEEVPLGKGPCIPCLT